MNRVYNFSAGPSCMPEEVLKECAQEMLCFKQTGQSVMEMSHRSKDYKSIIENTEKCLKALMNIPENYTVLFLQGGASLQFSMLPLNIGIHYKKATYINTGIWSKKAIAEAKKIICADVISSSEDKRFSYIPKVEKISGDYDYAYICMNNTIVGTRYNYIPETANIPLVADMSSCILSEPVDVSKFALIFAGAQKNLAPAGVTIVIIRNDLIEKNQSEKIPSMLSYKVHADNASMYNTPPCYTIYVMGKVLEWIERNGGAEGMKKRNYEKAELFYNYLDSSSYYYGTAQKESRSFMNIPFLIKDREKDEDLNKKFVKEAAASGLVNLAGHRLTGGMRASLYNAMPIEGVKTLIDFMEKFALENK